MKRSAGFLKHVTLFCIIGLTIGIFICPAAWGGAYFTDDMEGDANWAGEGAWATTTTDAHSGSKSWTDSPAGVYPNLANVSLALSNPIDLSPSINPKLVFWHKYQLETDWDYGRLEISTDNGTTWTHLASFTGVYDWQREQLDLSAYKTDNVKIRFRLESDSRIAYDGWYIDDVRISELPNPVLDMGVTRSIAAPSTSLNLTWTQNVDADFASYRIYRSQAAGVSTDSFLVAAISNNSQTSYTDTNLTPETTCYYKVYVFNTFDLGAGGVEASGATSAAEFGYPFFDDMEGSVSAWTAASPWGLVTISANESRSGLTSTVWTDSPGGSYAAGADTSLQMTIDLGSATMPLLSFWHKHTINTNSDYIYIEVKEDGSTSWKRLYFATGTQASWAEERVDLSNYAGKKIHIRFRLTSDTNGIQSNGWLIDDVKIDETEWAVLTYPFTDDLENAASADNWHSSSWALVSPGNSSSNNAFTDSPAGDYGAYVTSELIMANSIDMTGSVHPQLSFWHTYDTRNCIQHSGTGGCSSEANDVDYGYVHLSTFNGQSGTWTQIASFKGSQSSWVKNTIDLSNWAGLPNVRIKFSMVDTNSTHYHDTGNWRYPGWTIDDIVIEERPVEVTLAMDSTSMERVVLSWSANADTDFAQYKLYRSSSAGVTTSSTLVATISAAGSTTYTDTVAMVQPETYYYRIWVVDTDTNYSLGSNEVQATYTVPSNPYPFSENGDGDAGKWSWGSPWGKMILSPAESRSGLTSTVWTDSPGANYPANANTSLTTFLNLSGISTPVLTFWHRYFLEQHTDFLKLEVSTDSGQTWTALRSFTGTETQWNQERVNLSAYAGQANLGFRFRLTADGANQQDGWYMDNLQILEESIQAPYPFSDDMESDIIPWFYDTPWGLVTLSAAESYSGAASVVWTDSPEGSYAASEDAWLKLTIDLGAANMPMLSFWQKYALESNADYGYIEAREVGTSSWLRIYFVTGTSPAWIKERVDLSVYAGKQVEIRYRLVSNSSTQSDGWYIDDIKIDETESATLSYPFTDDMEGGELNWHSTSWELVADAKSGSYAFTDSPAGDYGSLVYSDLVMAGSIDLSGAVHPQLSFWHKYDTRNCVQHSGSGGCSSEANDVDYGIVYLSTYNGQPGTWTQLASFKGAQTAWTYQQIDLSAWAGLPNVRIIFRMRDTASSHYHDTGNWRYPGWTIDDVVIEEAPVDVTLSVTSSSMNSVVLSWNANAEADFDHYKIYRSSTAGVTWSSTLIATISTQAETTYTNTVAQVQPGAFYRMWVFDADGNVSLGSNEVQATFTVPINSYPFFEDGESGPGKWAWGSPWGLTTLSPADSHTGLTSTVWTDSPGANYPASANTSLTTFLNLSGTSTPVLTFWHKYTLESGNDFVNIEVSLDNGQTWTTLRAMSGTETTWNQERIDLSAYAGNANLGFRFRLTSNSTAQQDGWYMDDLKIVEEAVQVGYPFYDDVESGIVPWFYGSPWGVKALTANESHSGLTSVVWTDSPGGSYAANADTSLQITVDLGSANMPVLAFWHRHALESNADHAYIEAREVGASSWLKLYFVTGTSPDWVKELVELSEYAGKQVQLRFRLTSNSSTQSDGWYIDDISIDETTRAPLPYPFVDDMDSGATLANWHTSSWERVPDSNSGAYAYTDSPAGDYGHLVYSDLVMASNIDLSGAVHPKLSFWHKYDTRNCIQHSGSGGCSSEANDVDYGIVYLSTYNGQPGTWNQIASFKGAQSEYVKKEIDISTWAGLPNVRIIFRMRDTASTHYHDTGNWRYPGWTIDDVRIGEDESIPSYIQKASGDNQVGQTSTALANPLVVEVFDPDSKPRSGIMVRFEIAGGGGTLPGGQTAYTVTSDANGLASAPLTLGPSPGVNTVTATIDGSDPVQSVTFSATGYAVGQAMTLSKISGDNQVNTVNLALANPLVTKVTDILGGAVTGIDVTFAIISGGGSLAFTSAVQTDGNGLAENTLTLGATTGETVVSVSSPGLGLVSFTAHAVLTGGTLGDADGDGMPDEWETINQLNPADASDAYTNADGDTLTNLEEYTYGTDPNNSDTDQDGMPDHWEVQYGLDPLYAGDAALDGDQDGTSNLAEYLAGTAPVPVKHFQIAGITNESMDFYGSVTIDGVDADAGDEVAVICPDNVICGRYTVDTPGQYGFMHVYKDDPLTTGVDEGAAPDDLLTFRIWDAGKGLELNVSADVVTGASPPRWTADGDSSNVNLDGEGKQIIPLHAGWNLISFSVKTCFYADGVFGHADGQPDEPMLPGITYHQVNSIADVFASINGLYSVVRSFDSKGLHTFDPADPGESNLKYVAGGYGYWIKMNAAGNLEISGVRALSSDTLNLRSGWNLAGYWHRHIKYTGAEPLDVQFPPDATQKTAVNTIGDVVSSVSGNYSVIRSYDIRGAHTFDPLLGNFNDLEYLGPGYGMWIKMSAEDALSY